MDIIPAILTSDRIELELWLKKIRDSHKFERVQIDFIDGEYANNLTVRPSDCDLIPYMPLVFDAHLMVTENNILSWSKVAEKMGFDRIIAQAESISSPEDFSCLAIDVHSPVKSIQNLLSRLKLIVVMAVEPGFGGQKFIDEAAVNIMELNRIRREENLSFRICVDGGIEKQHLEYLQGLGVDEAAIGVKRALEMIENH